MNIGGWHRVVALMAVTACSAARVPTAQVEAELALVGVNVVPMTDGDSILHAYTVLIGNGRVLALGPTRTTRIPPAARRIPADGQYLIPGLIDAHVHLEHFTSADLLGLFVATGVTSVRNMDGTPSILEWRREIAAGRLIGPSIVTAGPILDGHPPVRDDNTVVRDSLEARAAAHAQRAAGYDFLKVYTNLSAEAYRELVRASGELRMPLTGHVPRGIPLREALRSQHSVEHLFDFDELIEADDSPVRGRFHWSRLYLAIPADPLRFDTAARAAAAAGVWVVPTLVQADRALAVRDSITVWLNRPDMAFLPAEAKDYWEQQVVRASQRLDADDWNVVARGSTNRRTLLAALRRAGARVAAGTDTPNAFVVPGSSLHEELVAFTHAGYSPREALAAATRDAAMLLQIGDSVGTIAPGRRADLVLLRANPLTDIGAVRHSVGVVVRGRWFSAQASAGLLDRLR